MYKLLLRDLQKSSKKAGMATPMLDKAVQLTQDVPRRANDAMTLSSIYGYDGNIHKHGQLLLQVCKMSVLVLCFSTNYWQFPK